MGIGLVFYPIGWVGLNCSDFPTMFQAQQPLQEEEKQQQQLQEQQPNQGGAIEVSIVPGASSLTDTAFQLNPVQVDVDGR
jgi:hypothetical protein